ncbi:hypothetical protein HYH03_001436 [Edaphochlamys debaryana]|uniref:Uncharacterized protein n=1 Tax=Edaphochlamys debaryana TaxID=47281 RepID=A0A835YD37_9CHLO|nr:hypothetical protein HYH03_001436 [Edaphochlamys debaryana]|eukprot:KAG2500670.1 hypothetical protein HYH03_001436 [Edaphochlamys debaryana]
MRAWRERRAAAASVICRAARRYLDRRAAAEERRGEEAAARIAASTCARVLAAWHLRTTARVRLRRRYASLAHVSAGAHRLQLQLAANSTSSAGAPAELNSSAACSSAGVGGHEAASRGFYPTAGGTADGRCAAALDARTPSPGPSPTACEPAVLAAGDPTLAEIHPTLPAMLARSCFGSESGTMTGGSIRKHQIKDPSPPQSHRGGMAAASGGQPAAWLTHFGQRSVSTR